MRRVGSVFLSLLICLTACDKKPTNPQGKTLKINICNDPQTLDPGKMRDLTDINIAKMLGDGLTRIGPDGLPSLALAERVNISNDHKTYTFTLRAAQWSNGDPVTSYDFVHAFKRVLSPEFPAPNAFQLYPIKHAQGVKKGLIPPSMLGLSAPNDKTLIVELSHSTPYFLELLTHPVFFPHNAKHPEAICGPFQLTEWKHGDLMTFAKNPTYYDAKKVKLDALELVMVDDNTEMKMFEAGELHWVGSPFSVIPSDEITQLKDMQRLYTEPALATAFLRTNTLKAPFNTPDIRKAFAYAINRAELTEHITHGSQVPATGLVPLSMGLQSTPYFRDGNSEEALALFEKALTAQNLTRRDLPEITLKYIHTDRTHRMMQAIQQQWETTLGIHVNLQALESQAFYSDVTHQNYQLAACSWVADFNDPSNFLEIFRAADMNTNNTAWENIDYMRKLEASYTSYSQEERTRLLSESEQIIMDEMPIIPLYHLTLLYSKHPGVKNVVTSPTGIIDFKWAKLEGKNDKMLY